MVFIHGGAFKYGETTESSYGPDYLLEKNVVFVSVNYRLGALGEFWFGFLLSLNDNNTRFIENIQDSLVYLIHQLTFRAMQA